MSNERVFVLATATAVLGVRAPAPPPVPKPSEGEGSCAEGELRATDTVVAARGSAEFAALTPADITTEANAMVRRKYDEGVVMEWCPPGKLQERGWKWCSPSKQESPQGTALLDQYMRMPLHESLGEAETFALVPKLQPSGPESAALWKAETKAGRLLRGIEKAIPHSKGSAPGAVNAFCELLGKASGMRPLLKLAKAQCDHQHKLAPLLADMQRPDTAQRLKNLFEICRNLIINYALFEREAEMRAVFESCNGFTEPKSGRRIFEEVVGHADVHAVMGDLPTPALPHDPTPPADSPSRTGLTPRTLERIQSEWKTIAREAETLLDAQYATLARGGKLQGPHSPFHGCFGGFKVHCTFYVYTMSKGFDWEICEYMPTTCDIFRPQFSTYDKDAYDRMRVWRGTPLVNDEQLTVFVTPPHQNSPLHAGQDVRMNVQLCLRNCNGTRIDVGGVPVTFTDGAMSAFEDRLFHQVINNGDQPRISLAMGFIHPQLSSAKVEGGAYSAWTGRLQ